jgi:Holliday junction resolvase-like predicted endonuclease
MSSHNYTLGRAGEEIIAQLYIQEGYELIARNFNFYSTSKIGEIDLIFFKNDKLYLVEVKTRSKTEEAQKYGSSASQIMQKKMRALYKSYQAFVKKYRQYSNCNAQFDLACIYDGNVKVIPNAYRFDGF